jgi:hypothetical protein
LTGLRAVWALGHSGMSADCFCIALSSLGCLLQQPVGEIIRLVRLFMKETKADTERYGMSTLSKVGPGASRVESVCKALELVGCISVASLE